MQNPSPDPYRREISRLSEIPDTPTPDTHFALMLHRMTNRIRQSLELPEILDATVVEVQAFLQTDRVKIYQFHPDQSGEVVAEAIHDQRLPTLLHHNFPAEDIPETARAMFLTERQRSIVDITTQEMTLSPVEDGWSEPPLVHLRPVDPCHVEYLLAMGVRSSFVVPILAGARLWGLLVSHHRETRSIADRELQVVQIVADQLSIAIAQSHMLQQTRLRAFQEATINRINTLLHTIPDMRLQNVLAEAIAALKGCGGRLYVVPRAEQSFQLLTQGDQPILTGAIEAHPHWQTWLSLEDSQAIGVWAISDLYRAVMPSDWVTAMLTAQIRGILILRLQYQQEVLGYLSVFRHEIDTERIWAGRIDRDDPRQTRPRQSFETWREQKHGQANPWSEAETGLAQAIKEAIAVALYQRVLYRQVCTLNADLAEDIQRRKQAERKIASLNAKLEQRVQERTIELQQVNQQLRWEITERERALIEQQQAEASLERLSRQNELILNSAAEGIYGLDANGNITFVNPAAAKMLGYEVEELVGQWIYGIFRQSQADGTPYLLSENPIHLTLQSGTMQLGSDELFHRRDGSTFPIEYVSSPIQENGKIVGAVVLFKDITARQQVERLKDEFVSIVSHELRTPLTSIRSTLGLLASGWLNSSPEKSQRMLDIAFSNTNRLVRLINDVLDIERIKFGKVTMEKQLCNAADLMVQSADVVRAMADKTEITLSVLPIAASLWVDPDRIIQTFTNLLSNAIKFSPPGSTVWLSAEQGGDHLRFCVRDQGSGIPADKLETIFDRFQQVDTSTSRAQGGTGLGLTICRGIVQQHGGRIWVESQLGVGSRFYVTLPLASHEQTHLDH